MSHPQVGRFRDVDILLPTRRGGLAGGFRMEAFQCREMMNGRHIEIPGSRRSLGEFDNNITNIGLDRYGTHSDFKHYCHVGEGSAAENDADTTLDTFTAGVARYNAFAMIDWAQSTPPYYGAFQEQYRFNPNFGGGNVNISEVGIGWTLATGSLFSRALVKDGGGVPTIVPVLSTEYLDIWYTLRNYPDHVNYTTGALDDGSGSFIVQGVTYNYTVRCSSITTGGYWGDSFRDGFGNGNFPSGTTWRLAARGTGSILGPVTGRPSGGTYAADVGVATEGTYVPSTYTNTLTHAVPLGSLNIAGGGIKTLETFSSMGTYQMLLDALIPKDNTKVFNFTHRSSWIRKPL